MESFIFDIIEKRVTKVKKIKKSHQYYIHANT